MVANGLPYEFGSPLFVHDLRGEVASPLAYFPRSFFVAIIWPVAIMEPKLQLDERLDPGGLVNQIFRLPLLCRHLWSVSFPPGRIGDETIGLGGKP
jgi:hypothetical protein